MKPPTPPINEPRCCIDQKETTLTYRTCLLDRGKRHTCRHAVEQKGIRTKEQCEHWRKP